MPRRARAVFPGIPHHVTQRGNNKQTVFHSDGDRQWYLATLARHTQANQVRILGYALMPNHVHLIAVPERADSLAKAPSAHIRNTPLAGIARGDGPVTYGREGTSPVLSIARTS